MTDIKRLIEYLEALKGNMLNLNEKTEIKDIDELDSHMKAIGMELDKVKDDGDSILHLAVKRSEPTIVKHLAQKYPKLLLEKNGAGNLPLHTVMQFLNPKAETGAPTPDFAEPSKQNERKDIIDIVAALLDNQDIKKGHEDILKKQLKAKGRGGNLPMHLVLMRCRCPTSTCMW